MAFGFGFTLQFLWWIAAVLPALWIVGFAMRSGKGAGTAVAAGNPDR
ncbi:hypothetical protein ACJ6WE_17505 [Streptomyces sp. MMS24-I31]